MRERKGERGGEGEVRGMEREDVRERGRGGCGKEGRGGMEGRKHDRKKQLTHRAAKDGLFINCGCLYPGRNTPL